MILGVDVSLNSTGICVYHTDTKAYGFGASINLCSLSTKNITPSWPEIIDEPRYKYLKDVDNVVNIFPHKRSTVKPKEFITIGQRRLLDAGMLPIEIHKAIKAMCGNNSVEVIGIEDYSMASQTNNLIQICEITSVLKTNHLSPMIGHDVNKFYAIPGPKIKMLAGNGNFNKLQMLMAFIDLTDENITSTPFHKFCKSHLKDIVYKANVVSPVNDIIDAFWIVKYTHDVILGGYQIPKKPKKK